MKAAQIAEDRTLRTVQLEPLPLRAHDVRIAVSYAGICGSDLHNVVMPEVAPAGTVLGHEFSGVVVERGADVTGVAIGERVAVLPFEYCGVCAPCRLGRPEVCVEIPAIKIGGATRRGAFAESVVAPVTSVFHVPDELSDAHAAVAEPVAVGLHGVGMADVTPSEPVAVVGGGPIGVTTVLALLARGFTSVVGIEPNEHRRARLGALGIETTTPDDAPEAVPDLLGAVSPAAVFDCTGHPTGPGLALSLLRQMGELVFLGSTVHPAPLDVFKIVKDEIQIRGAVCYTHAEFQEAIDHLAAGVVDARDLITGIHPLEDAQLCFEDLMSGHSQQLKVLLKP